MPVNENYHSKPLIEDLGPDFYDSVQPASFPKAILRYKNHYQAEQIGLDNLTSEEWQKHFWSFQALPGNLSTPLALRYHGHQFTHYNPDLGDGRGFLFAQIQDKNTKKLLDLATKGSGQTPWSRRGDGRLTLKGAVREALATHLLEALGVNTSKTFCIFETGEALERGDEPSPTRSAVLTRLSHSHIRIGTFQRLAFFKDENQIQKLTEYCLNNYFPDEPFKSETARECLYYQTCKNTAHTTAQWMMAGFVHGVLNTDNINITGESFDYGPYRFLPYYDTQFVAAYFDHSGLYAFGRQPSMMAWNLMRFSEALGLSENQTHEGLELFQKEFNSETMKRFLKRLHLQQDSSQNTETLFAKTIYFMEQSRVPFEGFFFDWHGGIERKDMALQGTRKNYYHGPAFDDFQFELKKFKGDHLSRLKNTYFSQNEPIHLVIDEIENIWSAIDQNDDWGLFENKIKDLIHLKEIYHF